MQREGRIQTVKIRNIAKKLITELEIKNPPILLKSVLKKLDIECICLNPSKIADKMDVSIKKLNDIYAIFYYSENRILINSSKPVNMIRFSVGHELGHYMLHHQHKPHYYDYNKNDPIEKEADLFSSELLMPYEFIVTEKNIDTVYLADKYQVSVEAMRNRFLYDTRLTLSSYDYIGKRSDKTEYGLEQNFYTEHFPPSRDFIDNFEEAYDHYREYSEEDLNDLFQWIEKNDEQDSYPESIKAIKKLIKEFLEE